MGVRHEGEEGEDDSQARARAGESGGGQAGNGINTEEDLRRDDAQAEGEVESILRSHGIRCMHCN